MTGTVRLEYAALQPSVLLDDFSDCAGVGVRSENVSVNQDREHIELGTVTVGARKCVSGSDSRANCSIIYGIPTKFS